MFRRRRSTDDFAEEIKSHLELEADDLQSEGLSEEEARRRARVEFGNAQTARERFNLKSRVVWFDNLLRDIKFAIRQLARNRALPVLQFSCLLSASAQASPSLLLSMRRCWNRCRMRIRTESCRSAKAIPNAALAAFIS